jgi:hypothetical protein
MESISIHLAVLSRGTPIGTVLLQGLMRLTLRGMGIQPDVVGVLASDWHPVCYEYVVASSTPMNVLRPAMFRQPEGFTGLAAERVQTTAAAGGVVRSLGETGAACRWLWAQPHREEVQDTEGGSR